MGGQGLVVKGREGNVGKKGRRMIRPHVWVGQKKIKGCLSFLSFGETIIIKGK